jgi:hypothetical protein
MERQARGGLSLIGALPQVGLLLGKLAIGLAGLKRARGKAIHGFRQGLAESGLPEKAIEELAGAYPDFDLRGLS